MCFRCAQPARPDQERPHASSLNSRSDATKWMTKTAAWTVALLSARATPVVDRRETCTVFLVRQLNALPRRRGDHHLADALGLVDRMQDALAGEMQRRRELPARGR
ncbi:hypothetical protein GCM10023200_19810 [Actinomycetospora chlora]|uniref:Uncharacterized protein n=1 Tax=Actinomycetospora chlora TaxID=663608 RepID=A0ABP9ATU1_9PSEU